VAGPAAVIGADPFDFASAGGVGACAGVAITPAKTVQP
jgi:hypothetical protein